MIKENNFNNIYKQLIKYVDENGIISKPRGMEVKEVLGLQFILTNPLNCLCTLKERKLNYKFAVIEKMEYISGKSNPSAICHYNKNFSHFINKDTGHFDGSYGPRIGRQIDYIYQLLKRDPDSRQAVININNESDKHDTLDVPCTVSLQFLLRENKLNLVVTMRSNDLLWGTPYDVNGFCFLLEMMAKWLNVKIGIYIHNNGSTHFYTERKGQLLNLLINDGINEENNPSFGMGYDVSKHNFEQFWKLEEQIRNKKINNDYIEEYSKLPIFLCKYLDKIS